MKLYTVVVYDQGMRLNKEDCDPRNIKIDTYFGGIIWGKCGIVTGTWLWQT